MTDDEMLDAITAQRLVLIDRLESLEEAQWDTVSLCAGWRVRDVRLWRRGPRLHPGEADRGAPFRGDGPDWTVGDGLLVEGPGEALMLAVNRRRVALDDLSGEGAEELRQRMAG